MYTDHSALKHLVDKESKLHLLRWFLLLQEFALETQDKKGTENVVADHLFRLPIPLRCYKECDLPIDILSQMAICYP